MTSQDTAPPPHSDAETVAYFDEHVPEYSADRLRPAARFIAEQATPSASVVDIGCGVGNTLAFIAAETGIEKVAGIDVSRKCLEKTRQRLDCATYQGSILDRGFVEGLEDRFDFGIVAAVLHHLVGRTRRESRQNAMLAIENSLRLLRPGGHLIIHEPVFSPRPAMDAVFHLKRGVMRLTQERVGVLGYWGNIGAPLVSYYGVEELREMVAGVPAVSTVREWVEPERLAAPLRYVPLMKRASATLVVRNGSG